MRRDVFPGPQRLHALLRNRLRRDRAWQPGPLGVGVAYGGSQDGGNADALTNHLGLTGLPFVNVANGCATGGSALASAVSAIRSGMAEIGVAVGFDKHPRGAFNPRPADWGLDDW